MTTPASHEPAWLPDPGNASLLRWWDGQQWTQHTASAPPRGVSPPSHNRKRIIGWSVVAAIILASVIASGVRGSPDSSDSNDGAGSPAGGDPNVPESHRIAYYLTGSAPGADLTLQLSGGGTSQQQGVDVPLTNKSGQRGLRFAADTGAFLYISAQNNGDGTLTCRITEDGVEVDRETSSGEYEIVTCQGTA